MAWATGGLLLLWALAWLAVPPIVKSQAEQRMSALLGREVTIGRIAFAPWMLALTVEQLRIASAAGSGAPAQVEIARLMADADLRSLIRLAPVIEALEIDAPLLRVARLADGRYDVDDVLARMNNQERAPSKPDDGPARFALYNLRLSGGTIVVDDRPVQRTHELRELQVGLPFLSNLDEHVAVTVQPRIAFKLNGAAFDTGAQATPFAPDRASQVELRIADLDLAPWLPYLPASLPFKPSRGRFSSQAQVQFAMAADGVPRVSLRGQASIADAAIVAAARPATPALAWQRLDVALADVQPLARKVVLGDITLAGAQLDARRDAQGRIDLMPPPGPATATPAVPAPGPAANAWQLATGKIALTQARVEWRDATTQPAAALRIEPLDVSVGAVRWPVEAPVPVTLAAKLAPLEASGAVASAGEAATLTLDGQATDRAAEARVDLQGLDLAWLEPYLSTALAARVKGQAAAKATVAWTAGEGPRIKVSGAQAWLERLQLADDAKSRTGAPLSAARIALGDASVDLAARQVTLASLTIERPSLALMRDAQGRWNAQQWLRPSVPSNAAASTAPAPAPWQLKVGEFKLEAAELRLEDLRPAPPAAGEPPAPVRLRAALSASVRDLAWPSGPPARTQLQLRISHGDAASRSSARVDWNGSIAPSPLAARGALRVERFPVHAFEPYFGNGLNVALLRADVDWRGDIAVAERARQQWDASAKGNARITDLRVQERGGGNLAAGSRGADELLTWQSLALDGLVFDLRAGAKPKLEIASTALSDFYSRLVITEGGRFNLRDVAAAPGAPSSAPPAAQTADAASAAAAAAAASAPAAAPSADAGLPIDIRIGGVRLANGKVDFTDRFIRPNYSAALSELNGTLGAFDSTTRDMATLDLKGRAAGTALLEISGAVNPTARPLALDIKAKATDLELAPLSPYAGRYAGYAIERGKLSMDVAYRIDADGKLDAKNQVILNQLTFGEKVESPDATKLPVLLAVALLKDRNGVIDINLPVSGSINDPQFSVWGIVFKIIGNLLVKALTAPFALLAGGGEDLSFVGFTPGTRAFDDAGRATIDKVAKALTDRPTLKMTVTGAADPASEREAIQRAALDARIVAEQRRDALRAGAAADAPLPALAPAQREALLKRVYDDTKLPDKPRNAIGIARTIPAAEMEALLMRATVVSTDSARELALQRGLAVRDALVAKGLPSERLFLAAPRLRASGEDDKAWSPRVQLALSTN
jgi:uncharacterized protein involved in outer membrane biogenesis